MIARFVVPIEERDGGLLFAKAPLAPDGRRFKFAGFSFGKNGERFVVFELFDEVAEQSEPATDLQTERLARTVA
jgi:hypothetical protein